MSCAFKEYKKMRGEQSAREDVQSSHRENLIFVSILDNFESCQLLRLNQRSKEAVYE
jgi:hypothetical protein